MIRWLPFILVSILWVSLSLRDWQHAQRRRIWWWLGCWGLSTLTWTPVALSFGNSVGQIQTFWWAGGIWVIWPLQPASIDTSFWLNILMTVPQGIIWQYDHSHHRWRQWLLAGLGVGLTLEAGQALFNRLVSLGRWVDINDVITNCLGVVIGAAIMLVLQRRYQTLQ
ncbi:VanZ family protein [Levilactobacillus tujiorum]|uniref:VanZ family protein n=1 Tax=Levilactobacillus tujiorum TaxID=2912243 RepID=UPI001456B05A|nr:VanZ family protein [Levilactobacillus tujiorum]NLR32808.1 VanZ family protein [Levilactobacillus tujiorum]